MKYVVLSFNKLEKTRRCLESLRTAGIADHQIVLVHNGSQPSFVAALRDGFRAIVHEECAENRGYSGGANLGLKKAFSDGSPWCTFLSNDTLLLSVPSIPAGTPQSLLAALTYTRKRKHIDSIGAWCDPARGTLVHLKSAQQFQAAVTEEPCVSRGGFFYVPGSAFVVHRDVFAKTGGFDETLHTYWEDVDFSNRVAALKQHLGFCESFAVEHEGRATTGDKSLYTLYYYQRNRKRVCLKLSSPLQRPLLYLRLVGSWLRLFVRLVRQKRWADLPLLYRAILD